jgi:hypothetical protein
MRALGIILIVAGLLSFVYGGFHYKTRERVIDAGPINVDVDKHHSVPIPPIAGTILVLGGVMMLVMSGRSSRSV